MSNDEHFERKTLAAFAADRRRLLNLAAPRVMVTSGDDRDRAYRQEMQLNYALDMIGHLLRRVEELESRG